MMPFGPNDPNSLPAMRGRAMIPGLMSGPVPMAKPTPGFRPPGAGGAPGLPQQPQTPGMGIDPAMLAMMGMAMRPGGNEGQVNRTLDAAPPGGNSDPFAQGAAQVADMQGGWLQRMMKGLF